MFMEETCSIGKVLVLFGEVSCDEQGYRYLQPSACILQASAEQCGLSELVTGSLNGPEAPEGNPSQDVLGCSSGT